MDRVWIVYRSYMDHIYGSYESYLPHIGCSKNCTHFENGIVQCKFVKAKSNQLFLIPEGLTFVLVTIIKHKGCQG